jgi:pimeloyl-ACP methyl ester carboxylesterase
MKSLSSHLGLAVLAVVCCTSLQAAGASKSWADAASRSVRLGTNSVHYFTVGQGGQTIVLVHCWAGNSGFWREQIPALADQARLILVDLPGHGRSDKPTTTYTMDFFADAVLAVMRDAGADKAVLVGHSMGTPVICRVAARAPEKVAALVAVDGMLRRPPIPAEQSEQFRAAFRGTDYRTHTTNFIHAMFPNSGTETLRDRVLSEMLATPQYVMSSSMDGMFGTDQPDWDLKKVSVPVLVINANNPMWTEEYQAYIRSLSPQTDYRTIEGVGHWLMLEKPAEFNAALVEMLRKFRLLGT